MKNGGAKIPRGVCRRLPRPPCRHASEWIRSPGVRYADEVLRGHWLVNLIVLHQQQRAFIEVGRQRWRLSRPRGGMAPNSASLICADDDGHILLSLTLATDFPAPGIEILVEDGALFLPSEDWRNDPAVARQGGSRALRLAGMLRWAIRFSTSRGTVQTAAAPLTPPA